MHIKQVIISGFRSFRNQSEIEPFSPKHNVIVGRNGSGKSNFFDAIQFVLLSPKFANLRQEDRQLLLHEGAGSGVMAAYVEIIFDNSDGRLSVESDEVVLRRTVGQKKDEFFLNRKRVQKSEVISLLESAGFSKANPYYIVQQGKVSNLCVMKDKDRLELLKEVAGTTVYEERRAESLKITQETLSKQDQINEVLQFIEDRLGELEQEKDELKDYEQLDKLRRAYEFNLYEKELAKSNEIFRDMEATRDNERSRQQDMYANIREIQDNLQVEDDNLSLSKAALERILAKKLAKERELSQAVSRKSDIEIQISELDASISAQRVEGDHLSKLLQDILSQIQHHESELQNIDPVYEKSNQELLKAQEEMELIRHRIEFLYGKQGRGAQFRTKKERDAFLQQQINTLRSELSNNREIVQRARRHIESEENRLITEQDALKRAETEQKEKFGQFKDLGRLVQEKISLRNQLQEDKKMGWKELEIIQERMQEVKHELERGKQQLSSSLPRHISQGLATADIIANEMNLEGYYGPLIDNFELKNEGFRTAVEVAAGNALFHVIVDTDETAAIMMKELDKRRAGRLTFLPLNRLRNPQIRYPDSTDVRPLIDVAISYDADFDSAIRHVFGGKLLARDLDVAAHFSKEYDLDAVTRDGDVVNRRGGFEGGFRDDRESKIGTIIRIREYTTLYVDLQKKESETNKKLETVDRSISEVLRELQKFEAEREHFKATNEQLSSELSSRSKQLSAATKTLEDRRRDVEAQEKELVSIQQQISDYTEEQKSPLQNRLQENEKQELQSLLERRDPLLESIESMQAKLIDINATREKLRADLNGNLYKRRDEVRNRLAVLGSTSDPSSMFQAGQTMRENDMERSTLEEERKLMDTQIRTLNSDIDDIEQQLTKRRTEISKLEKSVETLRQQESELQEQLTEHTKNQDKLLNKRTMLLDMIQAKQRLIRDLGTVPRKEVDESKDFNEKDLLKKLKDVNERLKKYSSVNRKALDQYISFTEQRDSLVARKEELDRDYQSIQQLIETLDAQKEDAILRTFTGVSKHFSEVFEELVPGGAGELVMKTTNDEDVEDQVETIRTQETSTTSRKTSKKGSIASTQSQSSLPAQSMSKFVGVQVRVSFAGTGQQFEMQQLSGGQKALVALAIIFSIQRCDPAPFYLFDEIDQALDANYRAGVARLIRNQAESADAPAQFITTTFRPELVAVATKCYGIALQNKVSNIYPLDKSEAQEFVENIMQEEALGQVTEVPNYPRSQSSVHTQSPAQFVRDLPLSSEFPEEAEKDENMLDFEQAEEALKNMAVDEDKDEDEDEGELSFQETKRMTGKRTIRGTTKRR